MVCREISYLPSLEAIDKLLAFADEADEIIHIPSRHVVPQDVSPVLRWAREMLQLDYNIRVTVDSDSLDCEDGVVDVTEGYHHLVFLDKWKFVGYFEDSAGDQCIGVECYFVDGESEDGVLFLYERDLLDSFGEFRSIVADGPDDPSYGTQWCFVTYDGNVEPPPMHPGELLGLDSVVDCVDTDFNIMDRGVQVRDMGAQDPLPPAAACPLCFDPMHAALACPPCGHVFHSYCLHNHCSHAMHNAVSLRCAVCRTVFWPEDRLELFM